MSEKIETLVDVSPPQPGKQPEETLELSSAEQDTVRELVRAARASGAALTGPGGLLKQLTKMVVEAAGGRGDERTPRLPARRSAGTQPGQLAQRKTGQDGHHRQRRARGDRGPA